MTDPESVAVQDDKPTAQTTDDEPTKCPHCGGDISVSLVARVRNDSRMVFKLIPGPGELLTAKNVGAAVKQFGEMMKALGRDIGVPTEVLVERLETSPEGEVAIHMLIARWDDHHHSAANRKARAKEPELNV